MSRLESRCECRIVNRTIAPIIQRCAFCLNLEAENERLKASLALMTADRNQRDVKRLAAEADNERLNRELAELKQNEDHFAHDIEMLDRHLKVAVEALERIYNNHPEDRRSRQFAADALAKIKEAK